MQSVRVDISPNILNWVLDTSVFDGISDEVITSLRQWRTGTTQPTYNQIESISKKIHIPLGYFFLQNPPKETFPILEYRTVDSNAIHKPSRNLIDTIHHMEDIQDWMREHLQSNNYNKLSFVGALKNPNDIQFLANSIREKVELSVDWYSNCANADESFRYLRTHLENTGILVMMNGIVGQNTHRSLDIEEFRAFVLLDDYAPLVFINSTDSKHGKLFSLLHEAVHIWLGESDFFNDRYGRHENDKPIEAICNAVAAEILVPKVNFAIEWQKNVQADMPLHYVISRMATLFRCGETVIARRAFGHGFITQNQYNSIAEEAIRNFKPNKGKGGDYYRSNISRFGRPFVLALEGSVVEGKTTYTDAFRLTNTTRITFDGLTSEARGER
jgi:Zn-dependent peptidase ImmA (M78 family)